MGMLGTRAQRRQRAQQRRKELLAEIVQRAAELITQGYAVVGALEEVDVWLHEEIRKNPQQKQLYLDAVHMYRKELREVMNERSS